MIKIAKSRIDSKGRMTFPKSFILANNLEEHTHVIILPMLGSSKASNKSIKVEFVKESL